MVVAETLAGIALVKSATEAIKGAIGTANDVGTLAKHIDNLFEGEKQIQRDKMTASSNPLSLKSVAEETINSKLAQEQMDEMRQLIDARFGFGTWQGIVTERAKRIAEVKEQERLRKRQKQKQKDEAMETFLIFMGITVGCLIIVGVAVVIIRGFD